GAGAGGVQRRDAALRAYAQAAGLTDPQVATAQRAQYGFQRFLALAPEATVELLAAFAADDKDNAPWGRASGELLGHRCDMGRPGRIDNRYGVRDAHGTNTKEESTWRGESTARL